MRARERKRAKLAEIVRAIGGARTIAILSLHGLPAPMLAAIRARARESARIIVARTTLLRKALRAVGAAPLVPHLSRECALVVSAASPFELYEAICAHEVAAYARPGQIAPEDIVVSAGETQLAPGPVLSELKAAGLDARVVGGKITIAKECTVARAGTKITKALAAVLRKLDVKPIRLRARILAAFSDGTIFCEEVLHIDRQKFAQNLETAISAARTLALEIAWPAPNVISQLVQRAHFCAQRAAIEGAIPLADVIEQIIKNAHAQILNISAKMNIGEAK